MKTHDWQQASHDDDREKLRKWIPLVVPMCAFVLAMLIFLISLEVLIRP